MAAVENYDTSGDLVVVPGNGREPDMLAEARRIHLTPASSIKVRPVRWVWTNRVAAGTLCLMAGREGIGKSTVTYTLAADITRGRLPGVHQGEPRSVIVAATEDSWEHTIVPRLMAAGADLDRVFRIDVTTTSGVDSQLSLPRDLGALEDAVRSVDAALILLDPLMSRLDSKLDTHRDSEVRIALEPLVAVADRTGAAIIGLIHLNKSTSTDPLSLLMASRAFAAVARSVLFVTVDPDDEKARLLGQPKNNLGSTDLPSLMFGIDGVKVADTDEGPVWTGKVEWRGETDRTIGDVLVSSGETPDARTATQEAGGWLLDYLEIHRVVDSRDLKKAAREAGHSDDAIKRARRKIAAGTTNHGFPRRSYWSHPDITPDDVTEWLNEHAE